VLGQRLLAGPERLGYDTGFVEFGARGASDRAGIWRALSFGPRVEVAGIAGLELPAARGPGAGTHERAIRHWKKVAWPDIKKKPKKSGERSSFSTKAD